MKTGNRKFTMFLITFIVCSAFAFTCLLVGVQFDGQHVVIIITVLAAIGGWFAGMNVGEWFSKSKMTPEQLQQVK